MRRKMDGKDSPYLHFLDQSRWSKRNQAAPLHAAGSLCIPELVKRQYLKNQISKFMQRQENVENEQHKSIQRMR